MDATSVASVLATAVSKGVSGLRVTSSVVWWVSVRSAPCAAAQATTIAPAIMPPSICATTIKTKTWVARAALRVGLGMTGGTSGDAGADGGASGSGVPQPWQVSVASSFSFPQ